MSRWYIFQHLGNSLLCLILINDVTIVWEILSNPQPYHHHLLRLFKNVWCVSEISTWSRYHCNGRVDHSSGEWQVIMSSLFPLSTVSKRDTISHIGQAVGCQQQYWIFFIPVVFLNTTKCGQFVIMLMKGDSRQHTYWMYRTFFS